MPFKSTSQIRWCYAAQNQALKEGKDPPIDCKKWYKETKDPKSLPKKIRGKIYIGPRGGKYRIVNGKKIYLKRK